MSGRGGRLSHARLLQFLQWKWICYTCHKELPYSKVTTHDTHEVWRVPRCKFCKKYLKDLDKLNQHFAVGDSKHKEAYYQAYPSRRPTWIIVAKNTVVIN